VRYYLFLITTLLFSGVFVLDGFALQQVAGPIIVDVKPGETKTFNWSLLSDKSDAPTNVKISAEGKGSEFLSFSKDYTIDPRSSVMVEFTVTIPDDHPGGVQLSPMLFATEFGETGGNTVLNIQMLKIPTITIAENENPEFKLSTKYDYKSTDAKTAALLPPDVESTQVDPEPTEEKTQVTGGAQIVSPTQVESTPASEEKKGCLIATATYGSELAPQVQLLREIRDNVLFETNSGTGFMTAFNALYYSFSPTISDWERQNPTFREAVKLTITPMLSTLSILSYVDVNSEQEVLGYGIGIILLNAGIYLVMPAIVISKIHKKLRQIDS